MPLLKNKTLDKVPMPEFLRDDELVFHCEMTNEIFRDYEEFAERTLLCNSMIWTCSMTGKHNLTYEEAQSSEEAAKKMLKEFPAEMKVPLLLIGSFTNRARFADLADDVFLFAKDRYFIGENVEASFHHRKWMEYKVTQVIPPTQEEIEKYKKSHKDDDCINPPASLYKYNLEKLSKEEEDVSEVLMANMQMVRRKKMHCTKDKVKLFLKQCVELHADGYFIVKQSALELYGADTVKFSDIFDGPQPVFSASKPKKTTTKQETLAKFLSKNNIVETISKVGPNSKPVSTYKKILTKQEKMEKNKHDAELRRGENKRYKGWFTPKEDLLLEDQKPLPTLLPVKCRIPDNYVGCALSIVEFVNHFKNILRLGDYFPHGFTFIHMENALQDNTLNGNFQDLLLMLLDTMYSLQEDEKQQLRLVEKEPPSLGNLKTLELSENVTLSEASKAANFVHSWCLHTYGQRIKSLAANSLTLTEILRLHLLTSGSDLLTDYGSKLKASFRGGLTFEDDPGLHFRIHNSYIIEALSMHNIVQLAVIDKLKILDCLVNQLLTYKEIRDQINDQREKVDANRLSLLNIEKEKRKAQQEFNTQKTKISKEAESKNEMKVLEDAHELKMKELVYQLNEKYKESKKGITFLGYDRALRRYIKLDSVPGIFVNDDEPNVGKCLLEPIRQVPELIDAGRTEILKYLNNQEQHHENNEKIKEELNNSDKENEPKEPVNNGIRIKENGEKEATVTNGINHIDDDFKCNQLNTCTSDPSTCNIHGVSRKPKWFFYSELSQLDNLVNNLNVRGVREFELQQNVKTCYEMLSKIIPQTPNLNEPEGYALPETKSKKKNEALSHNEEVSETLHTELLESVLEFEEQLYQCNIGGIQKNRMTWINYMKERSYDKIVLEDLNVSKTVLKYSTDNNIDEYVDPSKFIPRKPMEIESEDSDEAGDIVLVQSLEDQRNIKNLSLALLTVAASINIQYLKKLDEGKSKNQPSVLLDNVFPAWCASLMQSTSYSQIFLHYSTLYNSIQWRKTKNLKDNCVLCLKGNDPEKILLCDGCNKGHHTFCLKPKKTKIPQGDWFCNKCEQENNSKATNGGSIINDNSEEMNTQSEQQQETDDEDSSSLSSFSNMEGSEILYCVVCNEVESNLMLKCCDCPKVYHFECHIPPLKRFPRGKWKCPDCKRYGEHGQDGIRRSHRSRHEEDDLPLHNVALQELLNDVMKHEHAWPFIRPVQKNEVPDYYDVITKPMDFGTIKYKLNMGEYKYDEEFMEDARLIFENCNTYNNSDDDVYKCGVKLDKYFSKRCQELNLKVLNTDEETSEPKVKRKRTAK